MDSSIINPLINFNAIINLYLPFLAIISLLVVFVIRSARILGEFPGGLKNPKITQIHQKGTRDPENSPFKKTFMISRRSYGPPSNLKTNFEAYLK